MEKQNKHLSIFASFLILVSFALSPIAAVFADEKPKETTSEANTDKSKGAGDKKKKDGATKKEDGEEPDCE